MNAWVCDRCERCSRDGRYDGKDQQELPPSGWRLFDMPVRGSQGARSTRRGLLCDHCDDLLYEWLHTRTNEHGNVIDYGPQFDEATLCGYCGELVEDHSPSELKSCVGADGGPAISGRT